jgi:hypothetical protein
VWREGGKILEERGFFGGIEGASCVVLRVRGRSVRESAEAKEKAAIKGGEFIVSLRGRGKEVEEGIECDGVEKGFFSPMIGVLSVVVMRSFRGGAIL